MHTPISNDEFCRLASEYTAIPMMRDLLLDDQTPISIAKKLEPHGPFFLLESVDNHEKWGRYSILGLQISRFFIISQGKAIIRETSGEETILAGNPIDALQTYIASVTTPNIPNLPPFFGGLVGYLSFEAVRFFERCGTTKPEDEVFPDACFMIADHLIVFDTLRHSATLLSCVHLDEHEDTHAAFEFGIHSLDRMEKIITKPLDALTNTFPAESCHDISRQTMMSREDYVKMVKKAKHYITEGDIIQVVLAQQFRIPTTASSLEIYRALRYVNPSPYLYFLQFDQKAIAGSSPEVLVRLVKGKAVIRPIAGTRHRGSNEQEDVSLEQELLSDEKELAEHVMLVDLARNDLGRIAKTGTVEVTENKIVERYSHVMHLVSQVEGIPQKGIDAIDILKATFPAGTLSGAPKVRAMEIIHELEATRRGPYGGAIGYIGYGGKTMDMAITIRTILLHQNMASFTAGAGIVFDSVPEKEYEETIHKSNAMTKAITLAEKRLRLS